MKLHDIYISYHRPDAATMLRLKAGLEAAGIHVWSNDAVEPGTEDWHKSIDDAIKKAKAVVCILSPGVKESLWVAVELDHADVYDKPLYMLASRAGMLSEILPERYHLHRWLAFYDDEQYQERLHNFIIMLRCDLRIGDDTAATVRKRVKSLKPLPKPDILPEPFEWIAIPGGEVNLEAGGYIPQNRQTFAVKSFYIAKYPTTHAQYALYLEAGGKKPYGWREARFKSDLKPVIGVTWYDALGFCEWLSAQVRYTVTLPTEQQWQRAAQGDDRLMYPWGNRPDYSKANTQEDGHEMTNRVTQYPAGASPYGVMDMAGNVAEWCLNRYDSGATDTNQSDAWRVTRGGGWGALFTHARAAYRGFHHPTDMKFSRTIGFRCVANL